MKRAVVLVSGGLPGNVTRPEDRQNYTLLLAELRARLDVLDAATGRHHFLTIAAPAGPATYANLELDLIHPHLDWTPGGPHWAPRIGPP